MSIKRQVWQNIPISKCNWNELDVNSLTELNAQEDWLSEVLPLDSAIDPQYARQVLKRFIMLLEDQSVEVSEGIYARLAQYASIDFKGDATCIRRYVVPQCNSDVVAIVENVSLISNASTGMRSWQACLCLVEYLAANKHLVSGKTVVELGAGVGLLGLMMARMASRRVIMTDCDECVLQRIQDNVSINGMASEVVSVCELDWEMSYGVPIEENIDLVVCADVVYNPLLIGPLAKTIRMLLHGNAVCLVASTVRNSDTQDLFKEQLRCLDLDYEPVSIEAIRKRPWFYYEEGLSNIQVIRITLPSLSKAFPVK